MAAVNDVSANAKRLLELLPSTAEVEIDDETHELFSAILAPLDVWNALLETADEDTNVGVPSLSALVDLKSHNMGNATFLNSNWEPTTAHQIPIQLHNACGSNQNATNTLRIRWIDFQGGIRPSTHQWDISPSQTFDQFTQPGHLFLVSRVNASSLIEDDEVLLFGFRAKRPLPSGSPLILRVSILEDSGAFLLETTLTDPFDTMTVAAADLDSYRDGPSRSLLQQTLKLLQTILSNLLQHPQDEKYQKLRLGNPKVQQYIEASWSAMALLRLVGFEQTLLPASEKGNTEPYLKVSPDESFLEPCQLALRIIKLLQSRLESGFLEDLAPPTPWQQVATPATGGTRGGVSNAQRGWMSEEERWERIQRVNRQRQSGAARRPNPGEAPSSRGRWGR